MIWKSPRVNFSPKTNCYRGTRYHVLSERKPSTGWETGCCCDSETKQSWWKMKYRNGTSRQTGLKCGCSISEATSPALKGRCSAQMLSVILSFTNKADMNWCYHGDGNFLHVLHPFQSDWVLWLSSSFRPPPPGWLLACSFWKNREIIFHTVDLWGESAPRGQHSARYGVWFTAWILLNWISVLFSVWLTCHGTRGGRVGIVMLMCSIMNEKWVEKRCTIQFYGIPCVFHY